MNYLIISCFVLLQSISLAQSPKEQQFQQAVKEVVKAFSQQNQKALSKYIHPELGIYQLDRVGVFDHYNHLKTVSFSDQGYPQVLFTYPKGVLLLPLTYGKLPSYDCEQGKWSKKGMFVDTTKTNHLLSKICKDRNRLVPDNIPMKLINQLYELEKKSRRIVVNDKKGRELIFYLSYLKGAWYWTIMDTVTTDCSI